MNLRPIVALTLCVTLAACGSGQEGDKASGDRDPASEQALNDELMTDPDMAGRNEAGAALSGTANGTIPNIDRSARAIDAARARAIELMGGAEKLKPVPEARQLSANAADSPAMIAAARATVAPGGESCSAKVSYTSAWAARLPADFPVYPRGSTTEAAGTDEGDCALRVVTFQTPVARDDVLAFYSSRASAGGFSVDHIRKQDENVLSGTRGGSAYVVYARKLADGLTEIDLVTSIR